MVEVKGFEPLSLCIQSMGLHVYPEFSVLEA